MTEQELDSLGFRTTEKEYSSEHRVIWDWGSHTHISPNGEIQYIPILTYDRGTGTVYCHPFEFSRDVMKFDTMLEIINSVSLLMEKRV